MNDEMVTYEMVVRVAKEYSAVVLTERDFSRLKKYWSVDTVDVDNKKYTCYRMAGSDWVSFITRSNEDRESCCVIRIYPDGSIEAKNRPCNLPVFDGVHYPVVNRKYQGESWRSMIQKSTSK